MDLLDDGGFVVAWQSTGHEGGHEKDIEIRRFTSAGGGLSLDVLVNTYVVGDQTQPSLAVEGDGDFAVVWESEGQDGSGFGVFGRRFASTGTAGESAIRVSSYTEGSQSRPTVAGTGANTFVVAWSSSQQDGSFSGVFAQRLRRIAALDVDGNGAIEPLNDGILTLRYEFGFTGATLVTGAVDLQKCARCTAQAIEAYLASQE